MGSTEITEIIQLLQDKYLPSFIICILKSAACTTMKILPISKPFSK